MYNKVRIAPKMHPNTPHTDTARAQALDREQPAKRLRAANYDAKSAEVRRVAADSEQSEVPLLSFALWGRWLALGGISFSLFLFLWECEKKMLFVRLGEDQKKNNDSVIFCHKQQKKALRFVMIFFRIKKNFASFFFIFFSDK